jgi:hypothetical protein
MHSPAAHLLSQPWCCVQGQRWLPSWRSTLTMPLPLDCPRPSSWGSGTSSSTGASFLFGFLSQMIALGAQSALDSTQRDNRSCHAAVWSSHLDLERILASCTDPPFNLEFAAWILLQRAGGACSDVRHAHCVRLLPGHHRRCVSAPTGCLGPHRHCWAGRLRIHAGIPAALVLLFHVSPAGYL